MNNKSDQIDYDYLASLRGYIIRYLLDFDYDLRQEYTQDQVGRWFFGHYSEIYMPEESKALEEHGFFSEEEIYYVKEISNLLHEVIDPIEYVKKNNLQKTITNMGYNADMPIDVYEKVKELIDDFLNLSSIKESISKMNLIRTNGHWESNKNI